MGTSAISKNSNQAEAIVRDFFAAWQLSAGGFAAAIDRFFDDQIIWTNVTDTIIGKERALGFITAFPVPMTYITAEDITIASAGDTVFAKRTDRFRDNTDEVLLSMRLNGVFVIKDDKIAQWRDYVDTVGFGAEVRVAAACGCRHVS